MDTYNTASQRNTRQNVQYSILTSCCILILVISVVAVSQYDINVDLSVSKLLKLFLSAAVGLLGGVYAVKAVGAIGSSAVGSATTASSSMLAGTNATIITTMVATSCLAAGMLVTASVQNRDTPPAQTQTIVSDTTAGDSLLTNEAKATADNEYSGDDWDEEMSEEGSEGDGNMEDAELSDSQESSSGSDDGTDDEANEQEAMDTSDDTGEEQANEGETNDELAEKNTLELETEIKYTALSLKKYKYGLELLFPENSTYKVSVLESMRPDQNPRSTDMTYGTHNHNLVMLTKKRTAFNLKTTLTLLKRDKEVANLAAVKVKKLGWRVLVVVRRQEVNGLTKYVSEFLVFQQRNTTTSSLIKVYSPQLYSSAKAATAAAKEHLKLR